MAKEYACDTYLEYKFRHKNDLPIVTKKFSEVARLAVVTRDGYVPSEAITHRALDAVEQGRLSEEALVKLLG